MLPSRQLASMEALCEYLSIVLGNCTSTWSCSAELKMARMYAATFRFMLRDGKYWLAYLLLQAYPERNLSMELATLLRNAGEERFAGSKQTYADITDNQFHTIHVLHEVSLVLLLFAY